MPRIELYDTAASLDFNGLVPNSVFMSSYINNPKHSKPSGPPLVATRLLDQVRERLRYMRYSLQTEKNYVYSIKFFVRWHGRFGTMRHPREMGQIGRPVPTKRTPSVLTRDEIQTMLTLMAGETGLLARLLYGTGMRRNETLTLRVKDIDFDRHAIVLREAKGGKDRVVMLPQTLVQPLREQLARSRALWAAGGTAWPLDSLLPIQ